MDEKLVTIRNFAYGPDPANEAEFARIKLEANGIECFLAGRNFVSTYWLLSGADHGVRLQVRESDAERASRILGADARTDTGHTHATDVQPEPINPPCPRCGSQNVQYEQLSKNLYYLGILFLRFPIPLPRKKYKCADCGYAWR